MSYILPLVIRDLPGMACVTVFSCVCTRVVNHIRRRRIDPILVEVNPDLYGYKPADTRIAMIAMGLGSLAFSVARHATMLAGREILGTNNEGVVQLSGMMMGF